MARFSPDFLVTELLPEPVQSCLTGSEPGTSLSFLGFRMVCTIKRRHLALGGGAERSTLDIRRAVNKLENNNNYEE